MELPEQPVAAGAQPGQRAEVCEVTNIFESGGRGVQHSDLRAANRRVVLTTIAFNAGISNADVSRRTGLAPQTASAIVSELEAEGLVNRGEVLRGRRGQPATPLFLNAAGAYTIGCRVDIRHVELWLTDLSSRRIAHYRRDYEYPEAESLPIEIAQVVGDLTDQLDASERHRLIGIGLATCIDAPRQMRVLGIPEAVVKGWEGFDLPGRIGELTGLPALVHDCGAAACWAELLVTPPPRPSDFVYIYLGTFVSAGLYTGRTLWQGRNGAAANLGAMQLTKPDGSITFGHCVASLAALEKRLTDAGHVVPRIDPMLWPWQDWEPIVADWIAESGNALAQIVLNTSAVMEFDRAMLGGGMPAGILQRIVAATAANLAELPALTAERPNVLQSRYGEKAPAFGAAYLMVYRRFFANNPFEQHDFTPSLVLV